MHTIKDVGADHWQNITSPNFPFSEYFYLWSLEASGSVGEKAGWLPFYVTVWNDGRLEGATLVYLKNHSYGEYIFDWEWARAYQANGVAYYPKLVSAIPFTPATGSKLLMSVGCDKELVSRLLIQSALALMEKTKSSSLHFLFIPEGEIPYYRGVGMEIRHSFQYHWKNAGYASFSDFVCALKPKKGKQILREREQLQEAGVGLELLTGAALTPEHADLMYGFYLSTIEKMGAIPYLSRDFFKCVFKSQSERVLFLLAKKGGEPVAGSLSYFKGNALFGRYWGSREEIRNLHFELCYYRLIEFAIENKIELFEAGAQGEHKVQRGFLPELTYSAHAIVHPQFGEAISDFLKREQKAIDEVTAQILQHSPYKH